MECIPSLNFVLSRQNCISNSPLQHFQREVELFLAWQMLGILAVSLRCFSWGLILFADVCVIHRGLCRHLISCLRKDINKQMAITDIMLPCWKMVGWGILFSLQPGFLLSGELHCLRETLTGQSQRHCFFLSLGGRVQRCGHKLISYHTRAIAPNILLSISHSYGSRVGPFLPWILFLRIQFI